MVCVIFFLACVANSEVGVGFSKIFQSEKGVHRQESFKNTDLCYVEIKCQLDATEVFIADLIACSTCFGHHCAHRQELKSIIQWLLPVVQQHPANRTHNPQLPTRPTLENHSTKYYRQQPLYNTLELLTMGIVVPETC